MKAYRGFAALALSTGLIVSAASVAEDVKKPKHKPAAEEVASPPAKAPAAETEAKPKPASETDPKPKIVRTETVSYDNWTVNCAYTDQAGAKPHCSAILRVADKINNAPRVVFTWILGEQQTKPVSVISVLAGVLIAPGVELHIGDAASRKYNYSLCAPDHCEAIIAMDATVVAEIKRAPTVQATITRIGGQSIKYTIDTKGFDRALVAVEGN